MKHKSVGIAVVIAITLLIIGAGFYLYNSKYLKSPIPEHLHCVIDIKCFDDTTSGLITGYNYHLLRKFSESSGIETDIHLIYRQPDAADSLARETADILVIPFADYTAAGRERYITIDSSTIWLFRDVRGGLPEMAASYLEEYCRSEENMLMRYRFLRRYDPRRGRAGVGYISPYDDIVRICADIPGWDWRMLSALMYRESHFRIDAVSRRGARGLMQMMPATARYFGVSDIINPEESILAGANYLARLSRHYRHITDNRERIKFVLAAYNAGAGKIDSCINFAKDLGLEAQSWDEIVSLIPQIPAFKGAETTAFVNNVLSTYDDFCRICP